LRTEAHGPSSNESSPAPGRGKNSSPLSENERELRAIIDALPGMAILLDRSGRILRTNRVLPDTFGGDTTELIGRDAFELLPSEISASRKEHFEKVLKSGRPELFDDAREGRYFQNTMVPVLDDRGNVEKIAIFALDISAAKQTENALRVERDLAISLGINQDLGQTLKSCLLAAIEISGLDCGGIYLVDGPSGALELADHTGLSQGFVDWARHHGPESLQARIVKEGRPVTLATGEFPPAIAKMIVAEGLRSLAVYPIRKEGRSIACLNVASHVSNRIPRQVDILLEAFAAHIGTIIVQRRAESNHRESEERYRRLFDNAAEAIIVIQDDRSKLANPKAAEILGCSAGEIDSLSLTDFVHPDDREAFSDRLRRKLNGESLEGWFPFRIVRKDRQVRWVELRAALIFWEGQPATLNFIVDITDRRRVEQALKGSEERFRIIFEDAPDAYYLSDLKGNFLDGNKAAIELIGRSKVDVIGKNFLKLGLLPLPQIPRAAELLAKNALGQATGPDLFTLKADGRGPVPVEIRTYPVEIQGKTVVLGIARNVAERRQAEKERLLTSKKIRQALGNVFEVVSTMVEMKDPYTSGHQKRVANLARSIASAMGLPKDQIEAIRIAGTIHDLGKIFIPGEILSNPRPLSEYELQFIRFHPQAGYEILKSVKFPWPIAEIVHQHHERLDGSGYPQRLKGDQILIEARILSVADVLEAMSSHRPYRPALGMDVALAEIMRKKGTAFDPRVVDVCMKLFTDNQFNIEKIFEHARMERMAADETD
jgi:PAS domain S-box-containing protein